MDGGFFYKPHSVNSSLLTMLLIVLSWVLSSLKNRWHSSPPPSFKYQKAVGDVQAHGFIFIFIFSALLRRLCMFDSLKVDSKI